MSADDNASSASSENRRRRSSIVDIFTSRPTPETTSTNTATSKSPGSAMASAMAHAQQQSRTRRLSITSLGLSGSPTHGQQTSPFGTLKEKGQSTTENRPRPGEVDENAVDEETDAVSSIGGSRPSSPTVTRRVSFGAKTYRDTRSSSGASSSSGAATSLTANGAGSTSASTNKGPSSPGARRDGFNWSDNLRTRAERTSISTAAGSTPSGFPPLTSTHNRTRSSANSDSAPPAAMSAPAPAKPASKPAPDHFQERILKGDFYMD